MDTWSGKTQDARLKTKKAKIKKFSLVPWVLSVIGLIFYFSGREKNVLLAAVTALPKSAKSIAVNSAKHVAV